MFRCGRWERDCRALEVELEESIDPDNILAIMLKRNTNWDAIKGFIKKVQPRREEDERLRQRGNH
ncbi:Uncharacterized protein FWK35_00004993 [Aphis craccivora]|uniref:Uncharacterized protein n=1 Tax=Aphis craccivora TaxID=307492 RepID=A0A6G0Z3B8_APHCR|nr:Uncharacterized protein FWK35_00004993 [Aphis craccivora]